MVSRIGVWETAICGDDSIYERTFDAGLQFIDIKRLAAVRLVWIDDELRPKAQLEQGTCRNVWRWISGYMPSFVCRLHCRYKLSSGVGVGGRCGEVYILYLVGPARVQTINVIWAYQSLELPKSHDSPVSSPGI